MKCKQVMDQVSEEKGHILTEEFPIMAEDVPPPSPEVELRAPPLKWGWYLVTCFKEWSQEWENSNITVKSGRHHLDQAVKMNVIGGKSRSYHIPSHMV